MTLGIGNHVVKLSVDGKPLTYEQEGYIEFEVRAYTGTYSGGVSTPEWMRQLLAHENFYRSTDDESFKEGEVYQFVLLRKVQ